MGNMNSTFTLGVRTKVDVTELNKLKQQLKEIEKLASSVEIEWKPNEITQMVTAARQLDNALTSAFDVDLGAINVQKFNNYLKDTHTSLASIYTGLSKAGAQGQATFARSTAQLFKFSSAAKQTNKFLDKMAETMANTVRWSITSSILNTITGSVQKAYYYVKDLDTALNDIRIVTGQSADQMARFAEEANNAAKELAVSTSDYTQGALIYYQQGLDDETVKTLTDITAKTSNVTQQSMQTVSEQLTAVWNGYQVANQAAAEGMQVYEEYVDKMAAVGAATASDLEELSTAMSKVAAAANSMGVGFDELTSQIATIVSVTRQAPEIVGTALKTIYARLGDLQVDGVDEFGTKLGDVSGKLKTMGIDIIDANGNMRDMDEVMTEVAESWGTWTDAQRQAAAVAMAGKRQYSNLIALFDNWDMYSDTLEVAIDSAGTLDRQQSIALESLDNKLEQLTATAEDLYDSLFDTESLKDLIDKITPLVQALASVADAIGGLNTLLPMLGGIGAKIFSKHLAGGVATFRNNLLASKKATVGQQQAIALLATQFQKLNFLNVEGVTGNYSTAMTGMINFTQKMLNMRGLMSDEEEAYYNQLLQEQAVVAELAAQYDELRTQDDANKKNRNSLFGGRGNGTHKEGEWAQYGGIKQDTIATITKSRSHLGVGGLAGAEDVEIANNAISEYMAKVDKLGANSKAWKEAKIQLNQFTQSAKESGSATPKEVDKIIAIMNKFAPKTSQATREAAQAFKQMNQAVEKEKKEFERHMQFKQTTDSVFKVVGAIGQLASAWNTLSQLDDIWNNETLSNGEKFTQILMNIGFVLPMLSTAFSTLNEKIGLGAVLKGLWTSTGGRLIMMLKGETKATIERTIAQKGLNAAMRDNPVGAVMIALTALVGVIALVVKAYDNAHISAEEAGEALADSVNKYNETKTELEELTENIENVESRLKELYAIAQEDLTITDKEEIARLEGENQLLAAQLQLKKDLLDAEQKKVAYNAVQAQSSGTYGNTASNPTVFRMHSPVTSSTYSMEDVIVDSGIKFSVDMSQDEFEQFITEATTKYKDGYVDVTQEKTTVDDYSGEISTTTTRSESQWKVADLVAAREEYLKSIQAEMQEILSQDIIGSLQAQNVGGIYDDTIEYYQELMLSYYEALGRMPNIIDKGATMIFDSTEEMNHVLEQIQKPDGTIDLGLFTELTSEDDVKALSQYADTLGLSIEQLLLSMINFPTVIKKTTEATGQAAKSTAELNKIYEEQFDRFWDLTKQIDILSNKLNDLNELQSHLHGQQLIDSLETENTLLEQQAAAYDRLAAAQWKVASEYATELSKMGMEFNLSTGEILNYQEVTEKFAQMDSNSEEYKNFTYYLKAYEELLYKSMVDRANEQQRIYYEKLANNLEAFEVEIQMSLDDAEATRDLNEFYKNINKNFRAISEDLGAELTQAFSNYESYVLDNGTLSALTSAIGSVQGEIDTIMAGGESSMFASLSAAQEKLKELQEELMTATTEAYDEMETYWDTYLSSIDEAADKFDELNEKFKDVSAELEHQSQLVELIYGSEAYDLQGQILNAQVNTSLASIAAIKAQIDEYKELQKNTTEGQEDYLKYQELINAKQSELNSLTIEHINLLKSEYSNTMAQIIQQLERDITGGLGLDKTSDSWEQLLKYEEAYLTGAERIYELGTLENKFQKAINNTSSTKYQQAIADLMNDQLSTLKDKENLTEHDVELAAKRLSILEAEAALEDAQNAKNAMKLTRGADGNWSYQYVADASDIEEKQQNLMNSYNALYEFSQNSVKESFENLLSLKEEYIAKIQEIHANDTLSTEEKNAALAELNDAYYGENGFITLAQQEHYNRVQTYARTTGEVLLGYYKADKDAYETMTETEKGFVDGFKLYTEGSYTELFKNLKTEYEADSSAFEVLVTENKNKWTTAAQEMVDAWTNEETGVQATIEKAYNEMVEASQGYEDKLEELEATAGVTFGEEGVSGAIAEATEATDKLNDQMEEYIDQITDETTGLDAMNTKIQEMATHWGTVVNKIKEAVTQIGIYLDKTKGVNFNSGNTDGGPGIELGDNDENDEDDRDTSFVSPETYTLTGEYYNQEGEVENTQDFTFTAEELRQLWQQPAVNIHGAEIGPSTAGWSRAIEFEGVSYIVTLPKDLFSGDAGNGQPSVPGVPKYSHISHFDTGGYTGSWDSSGRLAMLHQKELVLNASDTVNILETVKAVRDIATNIGSVIKGNIASMVIDKIGGIAAGAPWARERNDNAQQNVFHITAEFPNADSVHTIQEAILSLPNLASQYLAENKK